MCEENTQRNNKNSSLAAAFYIACIGDQAQMY